MIRLKYLAILHLFSLFIRRKSWAFKTISNFSLSNPDSISFSFTDVLTLNSQYNLNSSINLQTSAGDSLPGWIQETLSPYSWVVSCNSSTAGTSDLQLKFKVIDYWGDAYYTNVFRISMKSNAAPKVVATPNDTTFYYGQQHGEILLPSVMFTDYGDTFTINTSQWAEGSSKSVISYYNGSNNTIDVYYPANFYGNCTLAIIAKDSMNNTATIIVQIIVKKWAEDSCIKCTSSEIQGCSLWDANHILNLKNGEWVYVFSFASFSSLSSVGIIF